MTEAHRGSLTIDLTGTMGATMGGEVTRQALDLSATKAIESQECNEEHVTLREWLAGPAPAFLPRNEVLELFHSQHPRTLFVKTLGVGGSVLDVGAGDGVLNIFRAWPRPARRDLRIYAYALDKGRNFDDYDGYELTDWNAQPPFAGQSFDAIFCCHFIEHIDDPLRFLAWASSKLNPRGRAYIEWPSEDALRSPRNAVLEKWGVTGLTGNYFDDHTHRDPLPDRKAMERFLVDSGFDIDASGTVVMPLFEDELLAYAKAKGDQVALQFAYWLKTRWCQFIVASRPDR